MSFINSIKELFVNDIAIDLGTANTLIFVKGRGIVLSEPSVVAIQTSSGKVIAVGREAKNMLGKTPGDIVAKRPMREGVIADFEMVGKMMKYFISKCQPRRKLVHPRVVIGVPSGVTEVERRAVREAASQAGATKIYLIEESRAAALGAGIPIEEPAGHMVVDIGGGTTEVSVLSLGGIVISTSIRTGGDKFDDSIMSHLKKYHNLIVGEKTAEELKIKIGSAYPLKTVETIEIKGRDAISGLPRTLKIDSVEVREALQDTVNKVLDAVRTTLDQTPPELASDIIDRGIVMTGGGSLLRGLPKFIAKNTGVPVFLAENPLTCVVIGSGKFLEQLKKYEHQYVG
ncbi:MAG: rod shape-determining protein [Spirochaetes bacterium GWF1_51_8]|nr:MAG: rod shape-determining protein [Spirochaetes bacterium GWF1_51_8]